MMINVKRAKYIRLDWVRRAQMLGMPDRWPSPDPIVQDMTTYRIAADQPYIHRLTALGVEAQRRGHGIEFAFEVSHLIFGGTRNWHQGEHLAQATARAGLDLADMDAAIGAPDATHRSEIDASQQALTGCIAGAASVIDLKKMLKKAGFTRISIQVKEESRAFIKDWLPGSGVEKYAASATIEANKPGGECGCDPGCCA